MIRTFRFALATEFGPDLSLESSDLRLNFLFAVTRHLDGVLFTPSGLWDASGKPLLCADGRSDAEAVLPEIPQLTPGAACESTKEVVEPERTPPDARRVARRTLCLAAVSGRGLLEMDRRPMDFRAFASNCWFGPLDIFSVRFCDEDLAIGDAPMARAPEEDFRKALSAANERHLAGNWLADGGEVYSEIDTST